MWSWALLTRRNSSTRMSWFGALNAELALLLLDLSAATSTTGCDDHYGYGGRERHRES